MGSSRQGVQSYLVGGKGQGGTSEFSTILRFLPSQPGSFLHLLKLLSKLEVRQGDSQEASCPVSLEPSGEVVKG